MTSSAKVSISNIEYEIVYYVDIHGYVYEFSGVSFAESIYSAVVAHADNDKDFCEYIYVTIKGDNDYVSKIYSPAYLCAFDIIDRATLYNLLINSVLVQDTQEEIERD